MALKYYTKMAETKTLKTKSQNVLGANSYLCSSYRGKTGRGAKSNCSGEVIRDYRHISILILSEFMRIN